MKTTSTLSIALINALCIFLMLTLSSCDKNESITGESSEGVHNEGGEGSEGSGGEGEEGGTQYKITETCTEVRAGVQLNLAYDTSTESFVGTAKNVSTQTATKVRVEIHLSNGVELGPTTNVDLAPGNQTNIVLPAKGQTFATWSAHAEVGS